MKDTFKNFKEVKEQKYDLFRFDPITKKRIMWFGCIGLLTLRIEILKASEQGDLFLVFPQSEALRKAVSKKENSIRGFISFEELVEVYRNTDTLGVKEGK